MSGIERCRDCGTPLERPGDDCLTCRSPNADGAVVDAGAERVRADLNELLAGGGLA